MSRKSSVRCNPQISSGFSSCSITAAVLAGRHLRRRYDLVHVHNMPDFLVLAACAPRLMGARVILDIHDVVPELYVSKFNLPAGRGPGYRLMLALEQISRIREIFRSRGLACETARG